jgi:hypothetical protein
MKPEVKLILGYERDAGDTEGADHVMRALARPQAIIPRDSRNLSSLRPTKRFLEFRGMAFDEGCDPESGVVSS